MRAPLIQDGGTIIRIVTIDIKTGVTHQYAYELTAGSGAANLALNKVTKTLFLDVVLALTANNIAAK